MQSRSQTSSGGPDAVTPRDSSLIGRTEEVARLRELLDAPAGERPGIILVAGEAGIGKTRLAREMLDRSRRLVLRGEAREDATSPYGPLVQVARAYLRAHPEAVEELPLAPQLAVLLPELGDAPPESEPATLRAAICELADAAAKTGAVVLLEDLHWADDATLQTLGELAHGAERSGLSIVATCRPDEVPRLHRFRAACAELRRTGRVAEIALGPLSPAETRALAEQAAARALPPEVQDKIFRRSDGVPFLIEQLASSLAVGGDEVPDTLREAVRLRTGALSSDVVRVLELLASLGSRADLRLLADLADGDSLTHLTEQEWLVRVEGDVALFRHELVRDAVYAEIPWTRRRELHRTLAAALERRSAAPEQVANQWVCAGDDVRARSWLVRAAHDFCAVHAYRDAGGLLERALGMWETEDLDPERLDVLELRARCAEFCAEADEAVRLWRAVAAARTRLDDQLEVARARRRLSTLFELRGDWGEAVTNRIEAAVAFAAAGRPGEAAVERLTAASHLDGAGELESALALVQRAAAEAAEAGEVELGWRVLALHGEVRAKLGDTSGVSMAREAVGLALEKGSPGAAAEAYYRLASALEHAAEYEGAIDAYASAHEFCRNHSLEDTAVVCLACLAPVMRHVGRWKEAGRVCRTVMDDPDAPAVARNVAAGELGLIQAAEGRTASARPLLSEALAFARANEIFGLVVECSLGLAMIRSLDDSPEEASRTASELVDRCGRHEEWHYSVSAMRWSSTWFSVQGVEAELMAAVGVLSTAADRTASREARAALAHGFAEVALLNGDYERAVEHWERALALLESVPVPYEKAAMLARSAVALLGMQRREEAIAALVGAYRTAMNLGARPLAATAVEQLHRLGEPVERHLGPQARRLHEQAGLTRRQLEVLRHVAAGHTNRAIAEMLFLSPRTVDMHVRGILARLGCRSRTRAVARAAELGLLDQGDPGNTA